MDETYSIFYLYKYYNPRNENLNLLVRIKFLNLFLYSSLKQIEKSSGPSKV